MKILREANKSDFKIKNGKLIKYVGPGGDVRIPNNVTSIGDEAFYGCTGLTNVTIPDSVTSIGSYAFGICSMLTSISIPNSVISISESAFYGCAELASITVDSKNPMFHSDGNCIIETEAKVLITGCKNSIIPTDGSVTEIGYHAFDRCPGLTSITIPDCITSISIDAFWQCAGLTELTIPDSVTIIGDRAFGECENLRCIVIPCSVVEVGTWMLVDCSSLQFVFTQNQLVIDQLLKDGIPKNIIKSSVYDLYDTEED